MARTHQAAASHVGKIRSNNQDSAYAGDRLVIVADGMGGHAGGDIASAITVQRVAEADRSYPTAGEAAVALQSALLAANAKLEDTVSDHPELTGMGTTASALVRSGDDVVVAHIGDSRVYLFRDGALSQVTTDHTFVQRLVDSGRITEEEAMTHPRRSVLMRVLGDVDAAPEIDVQVLHTQAGDRWLLCSDGLSGYVRHDEIQAMLLHRNDATVTVNRLIQRSLDHGAPDNVTVVVLDIGDSRGDDPGSALSPDESADSTPLFVGAAAEPLSFGTPRPSRVARRQLLRRSGARNSHFEPASQDFLDELIEEGERRSQRRRVLLFVAIGVVFLAIIVGLLLGWQSMVNSTNRADSVHAADRSAALQFSARGSRV